MLTVGKGRPKLFCIRLRAEGLFGVNAVQNLARDGSFPAEFHNQTTILSCGDQIIYSDSSQKLRLGRKLAEGPLHQFVTIVVTVDLKRHESSPRPEQASDIVKYLIEYVRT